MLHPRVDCFVYRVAKAHEFFLAGQGRFDPRADLLDAADLLERFEDRRIRPSVQRTFKCPDGTGDCRIDIGQRGR